MLIFTGVLFEPATETSDSPGSRSKTATSGKESPLLICPLKCCEAPVLFTALIVAEKSIVISLLTNSFRPYVIYAHELLGALPSAVKSACVNSLVIVSIGSDPS